MTQPWGTLVELALRPMRALFLYVCESYDRRSGFPVASRFQDVGSSSVWEFALIETSLAPSFCMAYDVFDWDKLEIFLGILSALEAEQ